MPVYVNGGDETTHSLGKSAILCPSTGLLCFLQTIQLLIKDVTVDPWYPKAIRSYLIHGKSFPLVRNFVVKVSNDHFL